MACVKVLSAVTVNSKNVTIECRGYSATMNDNLSDTGLHVNQAPFTTKIPKVV